MILSIENLTTAFYGKTTVLKAVDRLHLTIQEGESVALVGESGSGKTVTALSILQLLPPAGAIDSGAIYFRDKNLLELSERDMRHVRGKNIGLILQDPLAALNPLMRVGEQIAEVMRYHFGYSKKQAKSETLLLMERVRLEDVERIYAAYPHELSGGLRQRALIAVALAAQPALLIADEPTTALDTTIQSEILKLLKSLQHEFQLTLLLITHDLGVVANIAEKVAVMYAGQVVECSPTETLFSHPMHPYTELLLNSMPQVPWPIRRSPGDFHSKGRNAISGCVFSARCYMADDQCRHSEPINNYIDPTHSVKCIKRGNTSYEQ